MSNIEGISSRLKAAGTTSRKRGAEKTTKALTWVYQWGWSSPQLIDHVASPGRRGLTKKLVEQGLLTAHPCPGAGGQKGLPKTAITLTPEGQTLVEGKLDSVDDLLDQNFEQDIPWHQLRHDGLVQRATANNANLLGFLTPKQIKQKSMTGIKQPDVIWINKDGSRIGIELELTHKKRGREISQTIISLIRSVSADNVFDLSNVLILSHSKSILNDYKNHLTPGKRINIWGRDSSRRWIETEEHILIPDWSFSKIKLGGITL